MQTKNPQNTMGLVSAAEHVWTRRPRAAAACKHPTSREWRLRGRECKTPATQTTAGEWRDAHRRKWNVTRNRSSSPSSSKSGSILWSVAGTVDAASLPAAFGGLAFAAAGPHGTHPAPTRG